MALTREEVRRVADLARLELSSAEESRLSEELGRIVDYVGQLAGYATAPDAHWNTEGAPGAGDIGSDEARPGLDPRVVLANAPRSQGPFVVVPQVIAADD
jgi:aspartyl-tRNA(Asn)/glutamyl-tRNA(Gln) amidotransferase subunit C